MNHDDHAADAAEQYTRAEGLEATVAELRAEIARLTESRKKREEEILDYHFKIAKYVDELDAEKVLLIAAIRYTTDECPNCGTYLDGVTCVANHDPDCTFRVMLSVPEKK